MNKLIRASALRGYFDLMKQFNLDTNQLLDRVVLSRRQLKYEHNLLPLASVARLLELSSEQVNCGDLGLQLAHKHDLSIMGPLALLMESAETVGAGLRFAIDYLFVHSSGLSLGVNRESTLVADGAELVFNLNIEWPQRYRQFIDLCMADLYFFLVNLVGEKVPLLAVSLPYKPQCSESVYRKYFGCPVIFEQPHAGLHIEPKLLNKAIATANPHYQKIAETYLIEQYGLPHYSSREVVSSLVESTLGTNKCNKESICQLLAVHPRTLQRRLNCESTSFEQIKAETIKQAMQHYLTESQLPLLQVASILGYSEQSAMNRACRRWFGRSPGQLRKTVSRQQ
ncbi:AraC family transcriptional regulator [Endozoicomonas sp. G2_1]|uniref:AraC family transcriptional regulator n=1 Tax=Endozoicomonas sp. G2_1 TaxID=2821091 RepID=UPI001AD9AEA2|nr:AraC family transcriptional regulator [Endozoicomonas sp. G2_1]MBO9491320.1 AraC family transcriptional regulator [Endozoicomonas sp. G2_1]